MNTRIQQLHDLCQSLWLDKSRVNHREQHVCLRRIGAAT